MNVHRAEIRTGLLVVVALAMVALALLFRGSGRKVYFVYLENARLIQRGGPVSVSGREVGSVRAVMAPVPMAERPAANLEARIEVGVKPDVVIYRDAKVQLLSKSLLGETSIDFYAGDEASGLAGPGSVFIGPPLDAKHTPVARAFDQFVTSVKEALNARSQ